MGSLNLSVGIAIHGDTTHGCAVSHADIAVNPTRLYTSTRAALKLDVGALTLIDTLHTVVIVLLHQHGLVFVEQLTQVGGDGVSLWPSIIFIETNVRIMLTAQHPEEVVVATRDGPLQPHGRLFRCRGQVGNAVAVLETVTLVALVCLGHGIGNAIFFRTDDGQW